MWETIIVGVIVVTAGAGVVRLMTQASNAKSGCHGCCGFHGSEPGGLTMRDDDHRNKCERQTER